MTYDQYLVSNHWKQLRRLKLESVGYRCERCESTYYLQVHHRTYASGWFNTTLQNLEVLCWYCHRKEHGQLRVNDRPIYTQQQRDAIVARIAPQSCGQNPFIPNRHLTQKAKQAEREKEARIAKSLAKRNRELLRARRHEARARRKARRQRQREQARIAWQLSNTIRTAKEQTT